MDLTLAMSFSTKFKIQKCSRLLDSEVGWQIGKPLEIQLGTLSRRAVGLNLEIPIGWLVRLINPTGRFSNSLFRRIKGN